MIKFPAASYLRSTSSFQAALRDIDIEERSVSSVQPLMISAKNCKFDIDNYLKSITPNSLETKTTTFWKYIRKQN